MLTKILTRLARAEESLHPNSVILPNFPREIQLKSYNCGSISTHMIMTYFGKKISLTDLEEQLGTDHNGTSVSAIKRTLREYGLKVHEKKHMKLQHLKRSIDDGSPVIVSLYEGEHYSVVYGYSKKVVFVMNPSRISSVVKKSYFLRDWDHWGLIVSSTK